MINHCQKDSDIEWFEKIPDHWKVVKLKYISKEIVSGIASGERDQDGIIQLRTNNVSIEGTINLKKILKVPMPDNVNFYLLQKDDVLFNNTNSLDLVGKTAIYYNEANGCIFSNHLTRIRARSNVLPKWILFQLVHPIAIIVISFLQFTMCNLSQSQPYPLLQTPLSFM